MTATDGWFTAPIGTGIPRETDTNGNPVTLSNDGVTAWTRIGHIEQEEA